MGKQPKMPPYKLKMKTYYQVEKKNEFFNTLKTFELLHLFIYLSEILIYMEETSIKILFHETEKIHCFS